MLRFEARQWMPGPEGQAYTLGDVAYWAWTYLRVSVVTAVSSNPGVLMREAQRLEEAARPFGYASRNRSAQAGRSGETSEKGEQPR